MNVEFLRLTDSLEPKFRALLAMRAVRFGALPREMPARGIYLFSDGEAHLYVGRTNRLRQRLAGHCRPSATHRTAAFAFRIAREETNNLKATYKAEGSRAALLAGEKFATAFATAKRRVAVLDLRFVEEEHPTRQALLEIYVATVLGTPFNDFDNH